MRNKSRRVAEWLSDILRWGEKLERYLSGMSIDEFVGNEMAVDAASKCVEVIGERQTAPSGKHPICKRAIPPFICARPIWRATGFPTAISMSIGSCSGIWPANRSRNW